MSRLDLEAVGKDGMNNYYIGLADVCEIMFGIV